MNIQININKEQWNIVNKALDLYSRLQCGQIRPLRELYGDFDIDSDIDITVRQKYFPQLIQGESLGIYNDITPESAKISYDIIQAVRYVLALDRHENPEGGIGISFREPLKASQQGLPKVKINPNEIFISREKFKYYIKEIQERSELQDKLHDLTRGYDFMQFDISGHQDLVLNLLGELVSDTEEWISYWVYELNFGKKWNENSCTYADGTPILLKTVDNLYDFLKENYEKDLTN